MRGHQENPYLFNGRRLNINKLGRILALVNRTHTSHFNIHQSNLTLVSQDLQGFLGSTIVIITGRRKRGKPNRQSDMPRENRRTCTRRVLQSRSPQWDVPFRSWWRNDKRHHWSLQDGDHGWYVTHWSRRPLETRRWLGGWGTTCLEQFKLLELMEHFISSSVYSYLLQRVQQWWLGGSWDLLQPSPLGGYTIPHDLTSHFTKCSFQTWEKRAQTPMCINLSFFLFLFSWIQYSMTNHKLLRMYHTISVRKVVSYWLIKNIENLFLSLLFFLVLGIRFRVCLFATPRSVAVVANIRRPSVEAWKWDSDSDSLITRGGNERTQGLSWQARGSPLR